MKNFITTNMLNEIDNKAVENLEKLNLRVEDLTLEQVFKFANRFDLAKKIAKDALKIKQYEKDKSLLGLNTRYKSEGQIKRKAEQVCFLMNFTHKPSIRDLECVANSTIEDWIIDN
ncbi:hypothetical protein [Aliarcobacter lanthieri]|uniref:hypothetical protein n=1 Tax=Aliarcobacter lanthieri TaxID=1355374 RepID=UPI003AAE7601